MREDAAPNPRAKARTGGRAGVGGGGGEGKENGAGMTSSLICNCHVSTKISLDTSIPVAEGQTTSNPKSQGQSHSLQRHRLNHHFLWSDHRAGRRLAAHRLHIGFKPYYQ